ncbi:MAG: VOC family protein [Deltaproteobacteria bacterium]|nr:VOC family protein [Deltaproteobacteria bacterium]
MDPRINIVSLGVTDPERALKFYREGLGWRPEVEMGDFVLFTLAGGLCLALYPRKLLAEDAKVKDPGGFAGVTLAQNQPSEKRVDEVIAQALAAGGTLLKKAQKAEWGGYSGYVADPDGHPWEIAWNPHFTLNADGLLSF